MNNNLDNQMFDYWYIKCSCGKTNEFFNKNFIHCPKCDKYWCDDCDWKKVYDIQSKNICKCNTDNPFNVREDNNINEYIACDICNKYYCKKCALPDCKICIKILFKSDNCIFCCKRIKYKNKLICDMHYEIKLLCDNILSLEPQGIIDLDFPLDFEPHIN